MAAKEFIIEKVGNDFLFTSEGKREIVLADKIEQRVGRAVGALGVFEDMGPVVFQVENCMEKDYKEKFPEVPDEMMEKKAAYIKFHPPKDEDTINILHFKDGKISRLEIIGENAERVFEALNMKRQTMSGVPCIITGEDPDILKSLGNLKHKLLDVSDESISEWCRQCYMPLQGEKYIS